MLEFKTLWTMSGDITRKYLPPELGYKAFKAVADDKTEIAASYLGWKVVKVVNVIENTLHYANTPLHVGMVKYLREKGYKVPDHLIPPEGK